MAAAMQAKPQPSEVATTIAPSERLATTPPTWSASDSTESSVVRWAAATRPWSSSDVSGPPTPSSR